MTRVLRDGSWDRINGVLELKLVIGDMDVSLEGRAARYSSIDLFEDDEPSDGKCSLGRMLHMISD
jgi:hypothetical protein